MQVILLTACLGLVWERERGGTQECGEHGEVLVRADTGHEVMEFGILQCCSCELRVTLDLKPNERTVEGG